MVHFLSNTNLLLHKNIFLTEDISYNHEPFKFRDFRERGQLNSTDNKTIRKLRRLEQKGRVKQ